MAILDYWKYLYLRQYNFILSEIRNSSLVKDSDLSENDFGGKSSWKSQELILSVALLSPVFSTVYYFIITLIMRLFTKRPAILFVKLISF